VGLQERETVAFFFDHFLGRRAPLVDVHSHDFQSLVLVFLIQLFEMR
jgi:hypothetical protein